ncbi:AAA family ATPase [uncultured Haemophilus sp.]|jgi:energy-coupling factor transporter ATP-binding protein EcfA2|uniref:AAA family ATPase n=1 Tax=uncultured Haemophilus sp. TaxID=237779 RepID=UPI00258F017B|nr:AAA family ATPase [uncultured Haemophilus sp.]
MSNYINSWLENFERQAMIRRALIVSGNIIDLAFNRADNLTPINRVITESLKALGFTHVIYYSRLSGISGISSGEWQNLTETNIQAEQGTFYDMGDLDSGNNDQDPFAPNATLRGATTLSVEDFFSTVQTVMTKSQRKIAFIVDWSNYLFGQVNALSEAERAWLQQIASSLRDAEVPATPDEMKQPQSLLIFLCSGSSALPPSVYLNNPLFAQINIPLPNLEERQAAILARTHQFSLLENPTQGSKALQEFVTQTDTLTLRDIDNLVRLSRQQSSPMSLSNLISLYRYGKRQSPWEQLNYQRLKETVNTLQQRVKGQNQAIEAVNKILIRAFTGLSGLQHSAKARTPKGTLFFVGPTGVGKTELAKSLAQFLFGDEDACIRFDMSEFNHEHADQRLVGAPPGYVGFEEGGQLTNAIKVRPFSLLLFDEIEKAHPRILDKFLQILEDGRLTDGKGETVSFADTFIVFTSNIGASEIQPSDDTEEIAIQFKDAVTSHFSRELKRPELLGRIGEANIIPFNFMQDLEVKKAIAKAKLKPLEDRLKEKWGIEALLFENENKALETIVRQARPQEGGRGVLNVLIKSLFDPLADFLFEEAANPTKLKGRNLVVVQGGKKFDFELQ